MLELAVSYTPPGTDFAITLATVRDLSLLVAALEIATRQTRAKAHSEANPFSRAGFERQANYLERYLTRLTGEQSIPAAVM
jgi:hypothetical protein